MFTVYVLPGSVASEQVNLLVVTVASRQSTLLFDGSSICKETVPANWITSTVIFKLCDVCMVNIAFVSFYWIVNS
jgi:hypothetical protein